MSSTEFSAPLLDHMLRDINSTMIQRKEDFRKRFAHVTGAGMGSEMLFSNFSPGAAALGRATGARREYEKGLRNFDVVMQKISKALATSSVDEKVSFLDGQFQDWRKGISQAEKELAESKNNTSEAIAV